MARNVPKKLNGYLPSYNKVFSTVWLAAKPITLVVLPISSYFILAQNSIIDMRTLSLAPNDRGAGIAFLLTNSLLIIK